MDSFSSSNSVLSSFFDVVVHDAIFLSPDATKYPRRRWLSLTGRKRERDTQIEFVWIVLSKGLLLALHQRFIVCCSLARALASYCIHSFAWNPTPMCVHLPAQMVLIFVCRNWLSSLWLILTVRNSSLPRWPPRHPLDSLLHAVYASFFFGNLFGSRNRDDTQQFKFGTTQ